jgi:uncharacterized protein
MAAPSEIEIQAPGPQGPLKGAMVQPEQPGAPVVLIIPGSGPTDRDGNSPAGVKAAMYRRLAQGLAAKGVASVRIDKRGMFSSAQAIADPNDVTIEAYADDVHAWADAIRKTTGARCIWVLGHSEGALVALAAARQPQGLCGLILVSGMGRPLGAVLREQLKANPANAPLLAQAEAALSTLEAGRRVDVAGLNPALLPLFAPQVQGYLINLLAFDPATLLSSYGGPVLIVQGDRDLQVSLADAKRLHAADPRARLAVLPDVNHVLKSVASDDRAANFATYVNSDLPLAPGVVDTIAEFVRASPPARRLARARDRY